jgi:jumonji domain-containing protein 7
MSLDEIIQGNEHLMLHVDVTPDGHGDCIRTVDGQRVFVMPLVREMSLGQLTCGLRRQQQQQPNQHTIQEKSLADENGLMVFYTTAKERVQEDTTSGDDDKNQENDNNHHNNHHNQSEILYYSRQNDCLRTEVQPLMKFFPSTISFAEEAFNTKPEAVNIWIGNEKSVSSIHKDHYENIMCVTCGEKEFTICPPLDAMFLKESSFPTGTFCRRNSPNGHGQGPWTVEMNGHDDDDNVTTTTMTTRWIESFNAKILLSSSSSTTTTTNKVLERQEYLNQNPLLKYAHPIKVSVRAGDMFYLPSLWYHQVTQTCETVAVNYWYDMRFDSPQWCIFHLLQEVRHDEIHP